MQQGNIVAFGQVGLTVSSNVVGFGRLGPAGPKSIHMKLRGDLWLGLGRHKSHITYHLKQEAYPTTRGMWIQEVHNLWHVTCMQISDFEQIQENRLRVHSSLQWYIAFPAYLGYGWSRWSRGYRGLLRAWWFQGRKTFLSSLFLSSKRAMSCISSNKLNRLNF